MENQDGGTDENKIVILRMPVLPDLTSRTQIETLVQDFYQKLLEDELVSHFFLTHMSDSLDEHLPRIVDFWDTILLGGLGYNGNMMRRHMELNSRSELNEEHFERWLKIWSATIDENFRGAKADLAKEKAKTMKELMLYKLGKAGGSTLHIQ